MERSKFLEFYFSISQPSWEIFGNDFYISWWQVETCRDLVLKALDSQPRGPRFKITGWFQVNSAFHLSEGDQWSTRNSWNPGNWRVKRKLSPRSGSVALRQLNLIHKMGPWSSSVLCYNLVLQLMFFRILHTHSLQCKQA